MHDEQVRLIADDGAFLEHPSYKVDLSDDELRELYRLLVTVRRIDNEGTNLQRQGQLGIWAPCLGQEAAQVGSARALRRADWIFPSYREHGVLYTHGVHVNKAFELYRGVSLSGFDPHQERCGLYSIPIGTQLLHAVGFGLGTKWDGEEIAVVVYFGDGATSEGEALEAFNFAGVHRVPVVFFCQNNQWAISVPLRRQTAAPIWRKSAAFGFPGVQVDGNDVLAVYAVTRVAADRAREGGGPTLIEAVTYRLGAHTTSDDPTRYRTPAELEQWQAREPIARYRAFLERAGLFSPALEAQAQATADEVAAQIRAAVEAMDAPPLEEIYRHVYVDPPATLRAGWEELLEFESTLEPEEA